MSQAISLFNALIRHGIDDCCLYRRALSDVREPGLKALLAENAQALDDVVSELQEQVRRRGAAPAINGTLSGRVRVWMADISASRAGDHRDAVWVRWLARSECQLHDRFERGVQRKDEAGETVQVLRRQLCRLHRIHLDMHCLAGTTHH